MFSRLIRLGGALAAVAGGASWVLLCWRWHFGIGAGLPPLRNTQLLFWIPLLLMAGGLVGLHTGRPLTRLGKTGLVGAFLGSLIGAAGVGAMTCSSLIQDVLIDCEFMGAVLSGLGTAALYIGLLLFGFANMTRRALPRWNVLPLVMGLLALGSVPVGYVVMALDGVGLAQSLHTTTRILFGLGWVALGYVLWSDNDERAKQPKVAA